VEIVPEFFLSCLDGILFAAIIFAMSAVAIPDASSTGAVYIASRISVFSSLMLVAWIVALQLALEAHFRLVEQAGDGLVELWLRRDLRSPCSATGD
jgi:hypothetical protein